MPMPIVLAALLLAVAHAQDKCVDVACVAQPCSVASCVPETGACSYTPVRSD